MYKVILNRKKKSFTVKRITNKVTIKSTKRKVVVLGSSKRGLQGPPGPQGVGVPEGGNPGDVLTRTVDGTAWHVFDATDKYFEQAFSVTNSVTVNHNLNKYPAVTVHDSAGDEVEGSIVHASVNQLSVTFSAPFSGRVTCS